MSRLPTAWTERAIEDVQSIVAFIDARNPSAAKRIRDIIVEAAEALGDHLYVYRAGRKPGTREAVVHPNYILIYRVEAQVVRIVRVLHASQQYPPL